MSHLIIIREYRLTDEPTVREIIRQSLLSLVTDSFVSTLMKEITFQLIVLTSAIMFIFVGVPITYCIASIPTVVVGIYIVVYTSHLFKSIELFQEKPYQCWVAEACEPFFFEKPPQKFRYSIYTEHEIAENNIEVGNLQRRVIGTTALKKHRFAENYCWIYRLAVDNRYRKKGIATALLQSVLRWSKIRGFDSVEVSFTENQEMARQLFVKNGFQLKQMYHKQIFGSAFTLLKYQFGIDLLPNL